MFRTLLKYWHFALLAIIFMICEVTVDMIQPKLMATIVDDGILGLSGNGQPDLHVIGSTGLIMILIVLAGGLSGILSGAMANLCSQRFGNEVRKQCFARIMHLSFEQTDAFTTGSLITRITNDVTQLQRLVQSSVRGFVRCLMFMIVGTITLLSLNQHFLVILAIAFPLVLLDIIFILWRTNPLYTRLQRRIDSMNTVIRENVSGARLVKAFIQEGREEERFGKANQALVKVQLRILILMSYLRPIMNIILNLATVALIWIGAIHVQRGGMQPGEVMAAVTYISQILSGMMMLAMIFQTLSRGMASYRRLKEVLDTVPVIRDGSSAKAGSSARISDTARTAPTGIAAASLRGDSSVGPVADGQTATETPATEIRPVADTPAVEFRGVRFKYPKRAEDDAPADAATTGAPVANAVTVGAPVADATTARIPAENSALVAGASVANSDSVVDAPSASAPSSEVDTVSKAAPVLDDQNPEPEIDSEGSILRNIDLRIESGETLAIVGATGSGKTSLVNLIPRFYDATEGTVLVGGVDVRSYKLADLREKVTFVPQRNELFSTTIRENILIGRPGASEEDIRFAARCAQAESFILEQPQGFDTPVAEGGMSLSGGQRQRIAIARALLRMTGSGAAGAGTTATATGTAGAVGAGAAAGPQVPAAVGAGSSRILILDDSTSALDLKTEAALYDALQTHFQGVTRIVIAQRITTARRADRIAVLDHGKLVGCGTHEELMADCEVYQDICASQM